jgi:hypothetical protein
MNGPSLPPSDQFALRVVPFNDIVVNKYYLFESPGGHRYVVKISEKTDDHIHVLYADEEEDEGFRVTPDLINGATLYPDRYTIWVPYARPVGGSRASRKHRASRRTWKKLKRLLKM